jgi:hypothetical protein
MNRPVASLVLTGAVFAAMAYVHPLLDRELDCSGGGRLCPKGAYAESPGEALQIYNTREQRLGGMPTGPTLRAAIERKQAMESAKAEVRGATGTWRTYGRGTLITSGLVQELGAGLGQPVPDLNFGSDAGRVDNFAYDPVAKRLFAAVGTGGIWMTEARDNDVRTLGDLWVSIGDNLPTQANGAVLWTSAGGGTVVSASGDSVMSTGAYAGLGAYWSNDLGATWTRAEGFPDGALVFNAATDPGNPRILYIASSLGLYRSEDAGRSFTNVALPTTPECAGKVEFNTPCNLANVVSDVVIKHPGGTEGFQCSFNGCPVLAAVGWRGGRTPYPDGVTPQSPANGLYRSDTGIPGSFVRLDPAPVDSLTELGFTPAERIGRIEMGVASGPLQDHNYVYAMVHDAVLQAGGDLLLDGPLASLGGIPIATAMNGLYVSSDFGTTWARMADSLEIGTIPGPFVALIAPGQQGFYNQWVQVDPTRVIPGVGIPTRIVFGLEELFTNQVPHVPLNGIAQNTPQDFKNIGFYFSAVGADPNTHADQHAGLFIPTGDLTNGGDGGVCVFAGNDGGVYRQCLLPGEEMDNAKWAPVNNGFFTLLPYGLGVAKDGTVWFGLQDNGSGHVEPDTGLYYGDFGGDGFFAEVNPDNSDIAFTETPNGGLVRTVDRGASSTDIAPAYTRPNFSNWFQMDPTDPEHMITTANQIFVTTEASTVTSSTWTEVYSLGVNPRGDVPYTAAVADVHGAAIYVGACGDCGVTVNDTGFQNLIATNVGGKKPPVKGGFEGWHDATAAGLPNRFITAIEIDPDDPFTVYVGLGDYMSPFRGPGSFGDPNDPAGIGQGNIYKSTDAAETFTNISGDLPAVPVTTIVLRDGQLIIGTDLGMFISEDGSGAKWAPMGNGLPNVPVTMAKLQPGNPNRLFISTFGRGIWTYDFPADARIASARTDAARFGGAWSLWAALWLLMAAAVRFARHPKLAA